MATTNERLVGRVAEILNAREVVITLGRDQGIRTGMKFAILTDPLDIKDPESGESLGTLEREKTRVEAVDIRDRIAICRTYRSKRVRLGRPPMLGVPDFLLSEEIQESFPIGKDTPNRVSTYAEEYVKVGDRVVSLSDEDAEP